ncbi:unnamed protein product [Somion occarium]|uniref:Peptidase C45 hydrolase domain-containing protein n=1 Tax=Somion occarium TaxID=3059160 RepID=A0ABP1DV15_9APHY
MTGWRPPQLELTGESYEIGLSHGRSLRPQILNQIDLYRDLFQRNCKFSWQHVLEIAKEFEVTIGGLAPHLLEEMRGIADGVGDIGLLDIVALNSRSEIALGLWNDGCTALAWNLPSKQILAQNWDWMTACGQNLAMVHIQQAQKPDIWMVTEPGIVGKIGFNSSSVGVCLNAIRARPTSTTLLPIHVHLRLALESSSVDAAIAGIEKLGGSASSQHILIADARGGRGLELSPLGSVYLEENHDGILVHTNHFLLNKLVDEPSWLSGSPIRLERISVLCNELKAELSNEKLTEAIQPDVLRQRVFSDSINSPQAICCSPDPARGPLARIETLFNIVMVLHADEAPQAEVVFGRPDSPSETYLMPW